MNNLPLIVDVLGIAAHAHRDQRRKRADVNFQLIRSNLRRRQQLFSILR